MATLAFKPYAYVPTPPRSKVTGARRKPAPKQASIFDKLQHIKLGSAPFSTPRPAAAARGADDDRVAKLGTPETDTANEENDDCDLPSIEQLLHSTLQKEGFAAGPQGSNNTSRVDDTTAERRDGSHDHNDGSAPGIDFGGSPDDPIVLPEDDDSSASEYDVGEGDRAESAGAGADLFDGLENAADLTTSGPPSPNVWHNIDDYPETTQRLPLAEQSASTPDSLPAHTPSSRLSSKPLHDSISTDSKGTNRSSSPPPHHCRASSETRLDQEGHLHTGRGVADEHELVGHALDTLLIDKEASKQHEEEPETDEGNSEDEDEALQQEMMVVAPVATASRAGESPKLVSRRQSLPILDPSPEPSPSEASQGDRGDRGSDDELGSSDSAGDDEKELRLAKRKQPSSSHGGPPRKKRRRPLQQSPPRQQRPLSEPHRQYRKSHSPRSQRSRVATSPSAESRLPSLAHSMPQSIETTIPLNASSLRRSPGATLPTLTEITFRPHSAHCYAFTAVVRDGCDGRGVSLAQVVRLIATTGHVGKIDDFTIKPTEQHSYLLSGFSWHASSRLSSSGTALSTTGRDHVDATRAGPRRGRAVNARALSSQRCQPSSSDDDGHLSDSDPDVISDDDGCSSEGEKQGGRSVRMNIPWDPVDEQRLVVWKKAGKSWDWIFKKLPGRTHAAIRTRWTMAQRKNK